MNITNVSFLCIIVLLATICVVMTKILTLLASFCLAATSYFYAMLTGDQLDFNEQEEKED